ncbi:hypothetical protein [Algivirga pacifica]|uniref:Uncharacterized protein n=1 Tax=Algivirga pacifica TaxID=1162670 RepID=A0ABP9DAP2_9BACT
MKPKFSHEESFYKTLLKQKERLTSQLYQALRRDYQLTAFPERLKCWWKLTYYEFMNELRQLKVRSTTLIQEDWREFFTYMREQAIHLDRTIQLIEKQK